MKNMNTIRHLRRALCASLFALICCAPLHAQDVITLTNGNYKTYLESYKYGSLTAWRPLNRADLRNVKKLIFDASLPKIYFRYAEANNRLANLEELVLNDYKAQEIFIWGTKLRKVTIQNSSNTSPMGLSADNSCLSPDSIFSDRKFYKLQLKRTKVTDMERLCRPPTQRRQV